MFGNFLSNSGQYSDWAGICQHFDTSNQIDSGNQWRGRCNTWPRQEVEWYKIYFISFKMQELSFQPHTAWPAAGQYRGGGEH